MSLRIKSVRKGFTLIELLVTLVLIALVSSAVVPQIDSWLGARERATIRSELSSKLALLPLQASRSGENVEIENFSQLDLNYENITVTETILVLASGFCVGGAFNFDLATTTVQYEVTPPLCIVREIDEN